ncbi:NAD(+)/NADH kinase [Acinetobacter sp. S40]|uniref:diacylglycerol/lipid kinase family protein n=1 Tax=unclassified Acinetobacter TaxID=196816 RepID=UPI001909660D|nr:MULTISPECIES: diacylglycerol kinase family protein [unclassified Acinetobacter]MBJ9985381.1 NAD(+)/NADH kinase [Acinetobacter sp. S40]MBK0063731.1 NAD(+)/NADH kinase [Acinetobacter sp. S55]MBK0066980.1 NAD(+)/NADH kinase [Acinetobacter sp. S54]
MPPLRPLSIIYNEKSGFHAANKEGVYEQIMTIFTHHDFEIQVFELGVEDNFDDFMQQVLARHTGEERGVVVAAGGDGTLNAVASKLKNTDIPMGILPLGTFNYVARVLGIPQDLLQAAQVIATGVPRSVHVATINDRIYLNNASLGLYPLFIQKREHYNQRFGRFIFNAYTSGLDVLIRDHKELKLSVTVDKQVYPVKTPLIFFGNNQLQLQEMNLHIAECVAEGRVAGVVVAKSDKLSLFRMLFQLIKGDLEHARDVYSFSADQVIVESKSKTLTVAIDGEIEELSTPLKFGVVKNALNIMVPDHVIASV